MKLRFLLGDVSKTASIIGRGIVLASDVEWLGNVHTGDQLLLVLPDDSEILRGLIGIEHINANPPLANPYGLLVVLNSDGSGAIPEGTRVYRLTSAPNSHESTISSAYDQIAPVFRGMATPSSIPDNLSAYAHRLITHVGTLEALIDVGCGVGNNMSWFAARGVQVIGIDLSMGMLKLAQHETDQPLSRMSMVSLGFADHTFAAAWCCASLLHLPKDLAPVALSEIARVVKPSGLLMLSVQIGDGETWNGGYIEGVKRFFARYRLPEMMALLQRTGFNVIQHREDVNGDRTWLAMLCQVQQ